MANIKSFKKAMRNAYGAAIQFDTSDADYIRANGPTAVGKKSVSLSMDLRILGEVFGLEWDGYDEDGNPCWNVPKSAPKAKFTQDQLGQCFDNVSNKKNWKLPVNKVIVNPGEKNLECLTEAIIHFTGGAPNITKLKGNKVRVTAPGYYVSIGC